MMNLVETLVHDHAIRLQQPATNWQEAVKLGVSVLVKANIVEQRYYNAILASVQRNGPYFLLMPGVALPHARPEEGALRNGFSLVTLKEPVPFGSTENDPISILLSFAATDATSQLEQTLAQAAMVFEEEDRVGQIAAAQTLDEVVEILNAVDFSELEE